MWISHFLSNKPDKPIFHKNLDVLFFAYLYTHTGNTLLVDNTPYKNMFNGPYNAIFLDSFDGYYGEDHYLLGLVFPYLENLHSFRYGVPTLICWTHPFGRIKCIDWNNSRLFKMLLWKCSQTFQPNFCNNVKLKLEKKYLINCSSSIFSCLNI
jgi:hypothetical protein